MFSDVHDQVSPEDVPDPAVIGIIVVRYGKVRAVINGFRVFQETTWRLKSNEDIAVADSGDYELSLVDEEFAWRLSPRHDHLLLYGPGKLFKPFSVLLCRDEVDRLLSHHLRARPASVVGDPGDHALDQNLAALRKALQPVSFPFKVTQDVVYGYRRIKAEGGANPVVSGRVVVEDYGYPFLLIRDMPQFCPVQGETDDLSHPLIDRLKSG